ncbi:MAG TPA: hypothetical protein VJJ82_01020 [Candidatus Nanoarchaeia archaeon]|nr:hypothetical protein [Candidatus Nanoarchaeia archaeon]
MEWSQIIGVKIGTKMNKLLGIMVVLVFAAGVGLGNFLGNSQGTQTYTATSRAVSFNALSATASQNTEILQAQAVDDSGPVERDSPGDWIKERKIEMRSDGVLIKIDNPQWAILTNTNSMDPVFDETSHLIQIFPKSKDQIHLGDIVSYQSPLGFMIVHRVVAIDEDERGWYAILKGDNNPAPDPWKVRWDMVRRVTVMVVY